jgi:pentose-5-phosphate-3-epimerase
MPIICPTVLAADKDSYKKQLQRISRFGHRIQIDLTDNSFAKAITIEPKDVWWPVGFKADIHLMYQYPMAAVKTIIAKDPHLIIVHAEADGSFVELAKYCHERKVQVGVALLPATAAELIVKELPNIDHVLIFSGDLGSFGGHADLTLLEKVQILKKHKPELEVGWDGGVNAQNASELIFGGVDVLNVGGYIQNSDDPEKAYNSLVRIAEETGTT